MELNLISRDIYLNQLISKMGNGLIKVITGIRRCGKSKLLFGLFYNYLLSIGVQKDHIITLQLDMVENSFYLNPINLSNYLNEQIKDSDKYYVLLDEVQLVVPIDNPAFKDIDISPKPKIILANVLNSLLAKNVDVYVTGSNSKGLSEDIVTEFRGRNDQVHVYPFSFSEYHSYSNKDVITDFHDYYRYGGMPLTFGKSNIEKMSYLSKLFSEIYLKDIMARHHFEREDILNDIVDVLSSSVGSLTSISKLTDTIKSKKNTKVDEKTVSTYLSALVSSYLFKATYRYDVKGRKYIESPCKYYSVDVGLRNARLNMRQIEENHLMENIIYNELLIRGYSVDVGVVPLSEMRDGKKERLTTEIDFIVNDGNKKYYIQSAFEMKTEEKKKDEIRPLLKTGDSFKKIVIVGELGEPLYDENGILYCGIIDFLLNPSLLS